MPAGGAAEAVPAVRAVSASAQDRADESFMDDSGFFAPCSCAYGPPAQGVIVVLPSKATMLHGRPTGTSCFLRDAVRTWRCIAASNDDKRAWTRKSRAVVSDSRRPMPNFSGILRVSRR